MSTTHAPAIFLPGIVMPAHLRYVALLKELGNPPNAVAKELEVYAQTPPPPDYRIEHEIEGISRFADEHGFDRFHLYAHSGGGACAIAYTATHPERVISLALDEPASDFTPEAHAALEKEMRLLNSLPVEEQMAGFVRMQLAPGVEPPAPQPGPPPAWMEARPAGIAALTDAVTRLVISPETLAKFRGPVYYSYGSLSNPSWQAMRDRLSKAFPDFTAEEYEGLHHFNTSNFAEPARVARALLAMWERAERGA